ncbi:MAG: M20/M25/M40 family metallo-hydrolase [Bacteroidia bacterium]
MKKTFTLLGAIITAGLLSLNYGTENPLSQESYLSKNESNDTTALSMIFASALVEGQAYDNLRELCRKHPKRLSGSQGAADAVEFCRKLMLNMKLDSVWLQPCMVPRWERGNVETGSIIQGKSREAVKLCALGNSAATPAAGINAQVVEVTSFEELEKLGETAVKGKIVFFNHPFKEEFISPFDAYGEAAHFRTRGPAAAQKLGAAAVLVRSMAHIHDPNPHTGNTRFDSLQSNLPAAALSTVAADTLSKRLSKNLLLRFELKLNCRQLPDVLSYNVIGEIRGRELPKEVIVLGGHLDAWDLGEGAHDDGAGCMQSIEVLRILKRFDVKPRRTVRVVLWMNEENGLRGGNAYAAWATKSGEKHIAAIESDAGGFSPRGFGISGSEAQTATFLSWKPLLSGFGIGDLHTGGGGADIGPLRPLGTALIGLEPDQQRYFDHHHTAADVFTAVNRRELHMGAAAMCSLVWLIDRHGI